ncbi:hypothetical protein DSECCO2_295150 [anaerobic digester metagenome]
MGSSSPNGTYLLSVTRSLLTSIKIAPTWQRVESPFGNTPMGFALRESLVDLLRQCAECNGIFIDLEPYLELENGENRVVIPYRLLKFFIPTRVTEFVVSSCAF